VNLELTLIAVATLVAVIIIALSVKLSGRRQAPPRTRSVSQEPPQGADDLFGHFKQLVAEQPNNPEIWLQWGKALSAAASTAKHPNMRKHRYTEACACFKSATEVNASFTPAWLNWGQTLFDLYKLKGCEEQLTLDNAQTKFQTASRLSPTDASLWKHWGDELYMAASYCNTTNQRQELTDLADAKFSRAVQLNPNLMPEWKKWRGESGSQPAGAQSSSGAYPPGSVQAPESIESGGSDALLASAQTSAAPQVPWAHGDAPRVEASSWLTDSSSADTPARQAPDFSLSDPAGDKR
jgi:tetratricopeptide (TPR) repeat protein